MIEFEINSEKNSKIDLLSLYAICGEDEDRKTRLLVIGYLDYSSKVPVTDLTSPLHSCRLYDRGDSVEEVCKDFGINPQTARYFDDYNSFALVFRPNRKED